MDSCKMKFRSKEEQRLLQNRISRIEGQIKGVKQMIDENRYCDDILIQVSAIEHSVKALGKVILKNHMQTCMKEKLLAGNDAIIDEIVTSFSRLY